MHNIYTILQIKIEPYRYSLHSLHYCILPMYRFTNFTSKLSNKQSYTCRVKLCNLPHN